MKSRQIRYVLSLLALFSIAGYGCSNKKENNPTNTGTSFSMSGLNEEPGNSGSETKEEASDSDSRTKEKPSNSGSGLIEEPSVVSCSGSKEEPNASDSSLNEEPSSEKYLSFSVLDETTKTCGVVGLNENYDGNEPSDLIIPSVHDGYKVVSIEDYAFSRETKIKSIKRKEGIKKIGASAFYGCKNLSSVILPSTISSLGRMSFYQCSSLTEISFPSALESIGQMCFSYCSSLSSVRIPEKVKTLEEKTFEECTSLKNVTFGNGIESIGESAFHKTGIESLVLPGNIKKIAVRAFEKCESLTGIEFSEGLTTLGSLAFLNCSSLQEVTLPDSLTKFVSGNSSFGSGSQFEGCSSLSAASLGKGMKNIPEERFSECAKLTDIYIPANITKMDYHALGYPTSIKDIYYGGSQAQWNNVEIGEYDKNNITSSATIHYNSTGLSK